MFLAMIGITLSDLKGEGDSPLPPPPLHRKTVCLLSRTLSLYIGVCILYSASSVIRTSIIRILTRKAVDFGIVNTCLRMRNYFTYYHGCGRFLLCALFA